jgi:hypothetical protein
MTNWSGTYSITAGHTGVSSGSNTSNTFNNTSASWPTGTPLNGFTLRILGGTGAGQERIVASNTATSITISGTWTTIPDTTSSYEVVLKLYNGDHVTGNLTITDKIITELEDSATIYVDGNYNVIVRATVITRWNKSASTLVTFEANNRTVQGKKTFWGYFECSSTVVNPAISYIRFRDVGYVYLYWGTATLSWDGIHHLWLDECGNSLQISRSSGTGSTKLASILQTAGGAGSWNFMPTVTTQVFERCWSQNISNGSRGAYWQTSASTSQTVRECVAYDSIDASSGFNGASGSSFKFIDNYVSNTKASTGQILMGSASTADNGNKYLERNVLNTFRSIESTYASSSASVASNFNDWDCGVYAYSYGAFYSQATSYAAFTSDNDYIAGCAGAVNTNVDTSTAAASTASPAQYGTLTTGRTNVKTVRNRPLTVDNITSTIDGDYATIGFDCTNGVVAGQGSTTVNSDSTAGTTTVNVASTTGFSVGEKVEIGYGTARSESGRIASIGASTLVLEANLTYTHTAAQADTVKKVLRNWALPVIRYGTTSGQLNMSTSLPCPTKWGQIFTGIQPIHDGTTYEFKQTGHSVTLTGLEPATTYYYKIFAFDPIGRELTDGVEHSFTTSASSKYSDPGEANVRSGTAYKFNSTSDNKTGTLDLPATSIVKIGSTYDGASKTGTYDGSERYTDINPILVLQSYTWKYNTTGADNRTGTLPVADSASIADAVWNKTLEGGLSAASILRIMLAHDTGLTLRSGNVFTFKSIDGSVDRIVATVADSKRTSVTLDGD